MNIIPLVTLIEDSLIQSRASLPAVLSPGITSLAAHEGEESRCTHSVAVSPLFPATASGRASFVQTHDGTVVVCDPDVGTVTAPTRDLADAEIRRRRAGGLPATFNPWTVLNEVRW